MNISIFTIIIVTFFIMSEILNHYYNNYNKFVTWIMVLIRILIFTLTVCALHIDHKTYKFFEDSYIELEEQVEYNNNLIVHQDSLINYQRTMIDALANHLWDDHDCDIPQFDGKLKDDIDCEEQILDSLYDYNKHLLNK